MKGPPWPLVAFLWVCLAKVIYKTGKTSGTDRLQEKGAEIFRDQEGGNRWVRRQRVTGTMGGAGRTEPKLLSEVQ